MSKFDLVRLMWYRNKVKWKYRTVSGTPPLTYRAKSDGVLKNYRIYGNTVNGESVGDRTANLFDESQLSYLTVNAAGAKRSGNLFVQLPQGNYTFTAESMEGAAKLYLTRIQNGSYTFTQINSYPFTFETNGSEDIIIRTSIDQEFNSWEEIKYKNLMLVEGTAALPYEPYGYKINITNLTITISIYLDSPLSKSGNDSDYIDYKTQKRYNIDETEETVNLPALPTFSGTNTMSVGTTVQPSGVELRGRIKEVDSGGD